MILAVSLVNTLANFLFCSTDLPWQLYSNLNYIMMYAYGPNITGSVSVGPIIYYPKTSQKNGPRSFNILVIAIWSYCIKWVHSHTIHRENQVSKCVMTLDLQQ